MRFHPHGWAAGPWQTHNKKLKDPEKIIHNLLPRATHLGPKLGGRCYSNFLHIGASIGSGWKTCCKSCLGNVRYAFEFRELSWMNPTSRFPCEEIQCHILHL